MKRLATILGVGVLFVLFCMVSAAQCAKPNRVKVSSHPYYFQADTPGNQLVVDLEFDDAKDTPIRCSGRLSIGVMIGLVGPDGKWRNLDPWTENLFNGQIQVKNFRFKDFGTAHFSNMEPRYEKQFAFDKGPLKRGLAYWDRMSELADNKTTFPYFGVVVSFTATGDTITMIGADEVALTRSSAR